jgi:hypothetical protein
MFYTLRKILTIKTAFLKATIRMEILINASKQTGDKRINLYTSLLAVLFSFLLIMLCLTTLFFTWFIEGSEFAILMVYIFLLSIMAAWIFVKRCYYKIIFEEGEVVLESRLWFFTRKINYIDIYRIIIDTKSSKRRLETKDEFFEINHKDYLTLESVCKQRNIKIQIK